MTDLDLEKQITELVHAIRNDGWNNGFNTDDKPWIDQLSVLCHTYAQQAEKRIKRNYGCLKCLKPLDCRYHNKCWVAELASFRKQNKERGGS